MSWDQANAPEQRQVVMAPGNNATHVQAYPGRNNASQAPLQSWPGNVAQQPSMDSRNRPAVSHPRLPQAQEGGENRGYGSIMCVTTHC